MITKDNVNKEKIKEFYYISSVFIHKGNAY